jgi:vanillate O-demethylase ferredoxin subunit
MMQPMMTVRVASTTAEADDIVVIELADPTGADLPPFSAGAHIDVETAPGLVRQYSLCNNPTERGRYVIGVLKEPETRGGSAAMHGLASGQDLRISGPHNHFELEHDARRTLLFAGGIGVTPILCMAERLAAIGADFEMHYAARSASRMAFRERIQASAFAHKVHQHLDDGDAAQKLDIDAALGRPDPGKHVYICGPAGFIAAVLASAAARGFPEAQLHSEYFTVDDAEMFAEGGPFQVKLASSGRVLDVPADQTVLEVLRANGVDLPTSCEQGVCGTCITKVLEGAPEHRDYCLTAAEQAAGKVFTPCCSRSRTPMLVIDL